MRLRKYWPWLVAVLIIGVIFILKTQTADPQRLASAAAQINGPAIILFRGDNSPSCQVIHQLVSEAERRYSGQISFRQLDWSPDNPLIERYQVHFLPTVLLIDQTGKEITRTVGESPAVQAKLKNILTRLDRVLLQ